MIGPLTDEEEVVPVSVISRRMMIMSTTNPFKQGVGGYFMCVVDFYLE